MGSAALDLPDETRPDQPSADLLLPYITRPAIEWARQHRADLDAPFWREVEGTMVFGDVSGFTKMSERLARHGKVGAEEVADAINTCFEQLLAVAYQCGGNLLKFGGDALLLLFSGEDHSHPGGPRRQWECGPDCVRRDGWTPRRAGWSSGSRSASTGAPSRCSWSGDRTVS